MNNDNVNNDNVNQYNEKTNLVTSSEKVEHFCDWMITCSTIFGIFITAIKPAIPEVNYYYTIHRIKNRYFLHLIPDTKHVSKEILLTYGIIIGLLFISGIIKYRSSNNYNVDLFRGINTIANKKKNKIWSIAITLGIFIAVAIILTSLGFTSSDNISSRLCLLVGSSILVAFIFLIVIAEIANNYKSKWDYLFSTLLFVITVSLLTFPYIIKYVFILYLIFYPGWEAINFLILYLNKKVENIFELEDKKNFDSQK